VNFANIMVGYVYYPKTGALPTSIDTAIKISTSCGTVLGQLGFGFLADHVGRKRVSRRCDI
jgi:MFS transporter, PHS family, inorganic phosphate transporter